MAPKLCEYRDVTPATRSNLTQLDEAPSPRLQGRPVQLVHATAGWEPAGSVARWTDGFYAVWFDMNGARNGQRYRTEAEARAHFERLMTRED